MTNPTIREAGITLYSYARICHTHYFGFIPKPED